MAVGGAGDGSGADVVQFAARIRFADVRAGGEEETGSSSCED